ncbi:MAG: FMN-binding protein [Solobacterium sp.]|nr:FMN-binding protein [Solobacterium sp.]
MKRFTAFALSALLLAGCSGTPASTGTAGIYKAGTYSGTGAGKNGDVVVEVTVSDTAITSVVVKEHQETDGIADPALETLPDAIVKANGTEVDTVASATVTSEAIIAAVNAALEQAKK